MLSIQCVSCGCKNGLDGFFCRQCGKPLPADELNQLRNDLDALIHDGHRLLGQQRVTEAMTIANAAMEAHATHTGALGLYADVLEKQGHLREAIEVYEQIAAAAPMNMHAEARMMEIEAAMMKTKTAKKAWQPTWQMLAYGTGVAVILASVGAGLMLSMPRPAPVAQQNQVQTPAITAFNVPAPVPNPPVLNEQAAATGQEADGATGYNLGDPAAQTVAADQPIQVQTGTVGTARILQPRPSQMVAQTGPERRSPVAPEQPSSPVAPLSVQADSVPASGTTERPTEQPKTEPEPVIEINVRSRPSAPSAQASNNDGGPQAVEALIRVARERYAQGEYEKAAQAYEKAIRAGASKGSSNQRLAQCYEKLGQTSQAISAYKRAISAYEAQMASSPEDRIERALASCRKAIEVLGG